MADKSVTVTEPVANDVVRLDVRLDGSGTITMLNGILNVQTDDGGANYASSANCDCGSLPTPVSDAITTLVNHVLADFKTEHGF